jgi:putative transposase
MKQVVNKAYKFRIYPTKCQKVFFAKHFGCVRFIYNYLLGFRRDAYKNYGKSISGLECKKMIPGLKTQEDYLWLKEVNSQSLQEAALDLNSAYERFFKKINGSGYPKFKKKGQKESFSVPQNFQIDPKQSYILIPKLKNPLKAKFHRSMKKVVGFNSITFSKSPSGKYYASINVDEVMVGKKPVKKVTQKTKTVRIDLGLKDFLVESCGKKTNSPKYLGQSEKKLKKSQQRLSRKQKGSNNRNKQRLVVVKLHEKISNQRKNFLHKESARLVNENQVIYLETLNVKEMIKNSHLSKSIADSGWGEFLRQLKYKSHWKGSVVVQVGMWEATSMLCSSCDYKNENLKLSDREWSCPKCESHHDRDINAAKNIEKIGREAPELTPVKRTASVFSIKKIQAGSLKQESLAS